MHQQELRFRRLNSPDEDGLVRLAVHARNEAVAAVVEVYSSPNSLGAFADVLTRFPERIPSSASFEAASGEGEITISIETEGLTGHVAIRVDIQRNGDSRVDTATFWLRSEPRALTKLGQSLRHVAELSTAEAELAE